MELRQRALQVLCIADPQLKALQARELQGSAASFSIASDRPAEPREPIPGRPSRPELIHPSQVARRSPFKAEGLAALLHAIAHIEFNAINLALDAVWRFDGMPDAYYLDWIRVAGEEALHFTLLREHLATLGHAYGDFAAHDNLWSMCEKTKDDVVARMALVPRTLEARGLDATPQIQDKLRRVKTPEADRAVDILDIILRDEIGHVAVGNHWYRWLCEREGLDPVAHYDVVARRYDAPKLYPPFNEAARKQAGFSEEELRALSSSPGAGAPG
ncbi:ferritin-like domain-containing protein [Caenimonas aquaedulcis]|uniref:Ferritin-like domain-containing protein n=1 Tax=Caenimonas aquaedulcis TaxID=2793270 RepID=A0A931MFZ3_9BURK|nr:ferritin-like domain-containing protein [Caenimonas aquaedulcis]MBG9387587.1 ferritin-like domain-containing protein [Caenimonas aquaedulcis]